MPSGGAGASNGWALGGDVTSSGGGIVFANPHFPWAGEARFWECHLTVPGELDAYGVCLLGVPGIQMGFNEHLGWAHTFSKGHRFCAYQLRLEPGEPTVYRYGDTTREMTSSEHTVAVLGDAGETVEVTRELWRTHHGPMLNLPLLGWGLETAFSYRDANADNTTVLEQFLSMARARDVGELRRVFHDLRGMPWVNTMAADSSGDIYYCDASATPSLSEAATSRFLRRLDEDLVAALAFDNRIAMLDGSDPDDDWVEHPGARSPGLEPPDRLPEMAARDLVVNANDSHWLSHPHRTLEGYPVLCGLERTPRSLRTRQNLLVAEQLAERGDVGTDDIAAALFDNASLSGALLRDAVVQRCREAGSVELRGVTVDLWAAADVLDRWDLSAGLDAIGVVLWREFMAGFSEADWRAGGSLFAVPFDPADPVGTPNGLAPPPTEGHDPVLLAVAEAAADLADAGLDIDTPLGEVQWAVRGERRVPVHGGGEAEGMINVLAPTGALASASLEPTAPDPPRVAGRDRTGLGVGGYQVTYGTSFVMIAEFTSEGPSATGLLAYGQSGDDRSPHHVDGTEAYSAQQLRPLLFDDAAIEADPELVRMWLSAPAWDDDGLVP